jgi:hypothetical protein
MKKIYLGLALIAATLLPLQDATAQRRQTKGGARPPAAVGTPGAVEPVRALTGRMVGNKITARMRDDRPGFEYVVTGAKVVDGKLHFEGVISQSGKAGAKPGTMTTAAMLVGTLSRARNPWPSAASAPQRAARAAAQTSGQPAAQPQGREARNPETAGNVGQLAQSTQSTARTTQTPTAPEGRRPAGGEVNEQTQSLYTAIDTGSGCEIFFLKMQLPAPLTAAARASLPVQLGVVLAPMDNQAGEQINQRVCRVVRSLDGKGESKAIESQVAELNQMLAAGR